MEPLIRYCNTMQYPLKEFIDRTLGPGAYYRPPTTDLAMRWPPYSPAELAERERSGPAYIDPSWVTRPADRIAFAGYEQPGACIGHTAGLLRADFQ